MSRTLRSAVVVSLLGFLCGVAFGGEGATPAEKAAKLKEQGRKMAAKMEKLRELEFKYEVEIGVKTEAQLLEFLKKSIDEELPPGKIEAIQRAYAKMGLLPPDLDLKKTFLDMLASQVGGFYNPKTKRLFLIDRRGKKKTNPQQAMMEIVMKRFGMTMDDIITAHELTHALQDQHFGLEKMDKDAEGNDDRILAMKCVVEGDATLAMYEPLFEKIPMARGMMRMQNLDSTAAPMGPEMKNVPNILKIPLTFPYIAGAKLVGEAKEEGGWKAVNALLTDLPLSTEQVLHPEKYFGRRDDPVFLDFDDTPSLAPRGWKLLETNSFGELGVRIFLNELLKKKTAIASAAGWDGDRFAAYGKGDDVFFFWFTTWDSEKEAMEFARAYVQRLRKRYGLEAREDWNREAELFLFTKGKDHGRLEVRGQDVVVVEGLDAGETEALVRRLFREVKRRSPAETSPKPEEGSPEGAGRIRGDGFTVTPPKGWKAGREGSFSRIVMRPPRGAGRIEIGVLPLSEKMGAGDLAKSLVSALRKKLDRFDHTETESVTFRGRPARWIRFRGEDPDGGRPFRYAMHVVVRGAKAYIMTLASPLRGFGRTEKAGRGVLESLRFE